MSPVTPQQIKAIHALKARAGLDEDGYRDLLAQQAGVRSSKGLSRVTAIAVIDRLKGLSTGSLIGSEDGAISGALRLEGPYVAICRALWISGWQLGVVSDRSDRALVAFARRQTGIDSLNWVREARDGAAVVEALKAWLGHAAGVRWPPQRGDGAEARKRAVIAAQLVLLDETDGPAPGADLDAVMAALGRRVRSR